MNKSKRGNPVCRSHGPDVGQSCLVLASLRPSAVSTQISHSIWAQTPFIKVTLYTTFQEIRPHGCSEVTHIFLAIPISQIWDEFF